MANHHSNIGSQRDGIQFDQFSIQNNVNRHWSPLHNYDLQTGAFCFHSQSNRNAAPLFIWPENSKLSATAPEFIPRQSSNISNNSSLSANASGSTPKCHQNIIDSVNFSQREKLVREINDGQLECLVCLDNILPYSPVWSCKICFHIMHLNCIITWGKSSTSEEGWRCCACQSISKSLPREYYCFCGKTKNPQYNHNNVAHSCGDACRRINLEICSHPCKQLCHPGRCPPCQILRKCSCGKTTRVCQCNETVDMICGLRCDKELNCKMHKCQRSCHAGYCGSCTQTAVQTCYCKRDKRFVRCTKENKAMAKYSCGRPCDKQLKCGNHKCKNVCHAGGCSDFGLPLDNVKSSYTDPIPLCTATCKKRLTCGQPNNPHTCASKCHLGPCPPCNKKTAVKCRCSHLGQAIENRGFQSFVLRIKMKRRLHFHLVQCAGNN